MLEARFGVNLQSDIGRLKQAVSKYWQQAGGVAAKMLPSLASGGMTIVGFFGILLALPVSAVLLVWLRHIRQQYLESNLYQL
jgi:hypothetical protein